MPEGHTLHRLARDQQQRFGDTIVHASSPQGRFAVGAGVLDGRRLLRAEAYGKHLLHHYSATDDGSPEPAGTRRAERPILRRSAPRTEPHVYAPSFATTERQETGPGRSARCACRYAARKPSRARLASAAVALAESPR